MSPATLCQQLMVLLLLLPAQQLLALEGTGQSTRYPHKISTRSGLIVENMPTTMVVGTSRQVTISENQGRVGVVNSNSAVLRVRLSGNQLTLRALQVGSTTVTLTDNKGSTAYTVTVTAPLPLAVVPTSAVLSIDETVILQVSNARGRTRVDISDPAIVSAELDATSVTVTGLAVGSAVITVLDRTSAVAVPITVVDTVVDEGHGDYSLVAWNDLGMHCMDSDYSVFSILPPYNNLHAQLVKRASGDLVTSGITITYEATIDPQGSVNSTSAGKTNFWLNVRQLLGASPEVNTGLAGKPMASYTPALMDYRADKKEFVAEGIPITPTDDAFSTNTYPMVRVVAKDIAGNTLATARVVLPVSDEMSCSSCHASRSSGNDAEMAAKPEAGWEFASDPEIDYRRNILKLHDEKSAASSIFASALQSKGYLPGGLLTTANAGTPILCAGCHASNALPGTGLADIAPLTEVMHAMHAVVTDPTNAMSLNDSDNRSACYQCHPGSETRCLRGAMGSATEPDGSMTMQCQSCHGKMNAVGISGRVGWLEQPNCQACHHDGVREVSALDAAGLPKHFNATTDTRFASNPDTPSAGFSLFRMSKGHGDLQCEACHGATHAEYPSSHDNDNLLAIDLQGHAGTISECMVCHTQVPLTANGGPHGMHTIGQAWVKEHHDFTEHNETSCTACHGSDYRGGALATIKEDITFTIEDNRTQSYVKGDQVGCYDCHNGPSGD